MNRKSIMRFIRLFISYPAMVFAFYALILLVPDALAAFGAVFVLLSIYGIACARRRLFNRSDCSFAFCLLLYPLSLIPSLVVKGGAWSYFDYPVRCLFFVSLVLGLRSGLDNDTRESFKKAFFMGTSLGGFLAGVLSLKGTFVDHVGRVAYPFSNPIVYGQIAAIFAIISLASFYCFSRHSCKWLSAVGFLGAVYAVYASGSGGALLGLAVGAIFELLLLLRFKLTWPLLFSGICFCIALVAIASPLILSKSSQLFSDYFAFSSGNGMGTSQGQRLILWRIGIGEVFQSPWFGVGPGNLKSLIKDFCLAHICNNEFAGFNQLHNQYIDSFASAGFVGLTGLLVSFVGPMWLFFRRAIRIVPGDPIPGIAGLSVVLAAMTSAFTQALYAHNASVISYFFSISFLWFLSTSSSSSRLGRD